MTPTVGTFFIMTPANCAQNTGKYTHPHTNGPNP